MTDVVTTANASSACARKWASVDLATWRFGAIVSSLTVLVALTVSGNALVVGAVRLKRRLRAASGMLIVSLALADLAVGVLVLPLSAVHEALRHYWPFGGVLCRVWLAVDVWLCTASIYNLVAISLDRYVAIVKPLNYPTIVTRRRARLVVVFVWALSFAICLPFVIAQFLPAEERAEVDELAACSCSPLNNTPLYVVYSSIGSFFLPITVIVFIYMRIYSVVRAATRSLVTGTMHMETTRGAANVLMGDYTSSGGMRVHRGGGGAAAAIARSYSKTQTQAPPPTTRGAARACIVVSSKRSAPDCCPSTHRPSIVVLPNSPKWSAPDCSSTGSSQTSRRGSGSIVRRISGADSGHAFIELSPLKTPAVQRGPSPLVDERDFAKMSNTGRSKVSFRFSDVSGENIGTSIDAMLPKKKSSVFKKSSQKINNFLMTTRTRLTSDTSGYQKRMSSEIKAAKTVAIVTGCFIACWLGFAIIYAMGALPACQQQECVSETVFSVFFWLGYLNSSLNPIIYTLFNGEFRQAFKEMLTCSKQKRRNVSFGYGSTNGH